MAGQALDSLEGLAKAKRLQAGEFLTACPLVFRLEKKAPASKALKLIKLLVKQDAACSSDAAQAAGAALQHASPDVQEQALDLLEALGDKLPAELRGELSAAVDQVAAALRPRLEKLAGSEPPKKPAAKPARQKSEASPQAGLQARAAALPPALAEAAGVPAALKAIADETDPWPAAIDPRDVPRRDRAQAVAPIASLDELIDVVAAFVERVDDAMEVERILDGIHRFHSQRPDDFEKRTAALRKRIEARSERYSGSVLDVARYVGLAQLIRAWLELPAVPEESTSWWFQWTRFFGDRCDHIRYRIEAHRRSDREKRELPLLALPTHPGGWLDPVVLVERMRTIRDRSATIGACMTSATSICAGPVAFDDRWPRRGAPGGEEAHRAPPRCQAAVRLGRRRRAARERRRPARRRAATGNRPRPRGTRSFWPDGPALSSATGEPARGRGRARRGACLRRPGPSFRPLDSGALLVRSRPAAGGVGQHRRQPGLADGLAEHGLAVGSPADLPGGAVRSAQPRPRC